MSNIPSGLCEICLWRKSVVWNIKHECMKRNVKRIATTHPLYVLHEKHCIMD